MWPSLLALHAGSASKSCQQESKDRFVPDVLLAESHFAEGTTQLKITFTT